MLARPAGAAAGNGGTPALEWYPPGRLVAWAAGLGALSVIVAIPHFGLDGESIRTNLHSALAQLLRLETDAGTPLRGQGPRRPPAPARFSGGGGAAGRRCAVDADQRAQSLARRARRQFLRPAEAAVAANVRHDLPAPAGGGARRRHRAELRARPSRHPRRGGGGRATHGVRRARLRRAARPHPDA